MNRRETIHRTRRLALVTGLAAIGLTAAGMFWQIVRPPSEPSPQGWVNDVTQLNPIRVQATLTPTSTEEIAEAVRDHQGPISIGGARHSMGGQIGTTGALFLDMRRCDRTLAFSPRDKTITVQAGARWRQIQQCIDPENLSVAVMQSYANFTVGGSLSVNAHGRYVGQGPLITSVKSLKVVLADGSIVEASPTHNKDIFDGVIGGYGGLGVIVNATLNLADNVKMKRFTATMPVGQYRSWFLQHVRFQSSAIFHNADIYPDAYDTIHAVTYFETNDPPTIADRLIPEHKLYWRERFGYWALSQSPLGKILRQDVFDPIHSTISP